MKAHFTNTIWWDQGQSFTKVPCPGGSVASVWNSWPGGCEFVPRLRQLFFPAYFCLSPLQKHVKMVVGGFGKKSCVSTGVKKPGDTYLSPTAMIWPQLLKWCKTPIQPTNLCQGQILRSHLEKKGCFWGISILQMQLVYIIICCLIHYHTILTFKDPKEGGFWKYFWKRRKCW